MRDGPLTLLDILYSQLGHETKFAFLSVCKTATGDEYAPGKMVHLAAALQFSGDALYRVMSYRMGFEKRCKGDKGLRHPWTSGLCSYMLRSELTGLCD
ncbi:hypothetical protein JVU11DRAFT_3679 [Chiua virens]|nr:hypothetical protein JVU11DRAFT_3679 [Chiua virens]